MLTEEEKEQEGLNDFLGIIEDQANTEEEPETDEKEEKEIDDVNINEEKEDTDESAKSDEDSLEGDSEDDTSTDESVGDDTDDKEKLEKEKDTEEGKPDESEQKIAVLADQNERYLKLLETNMAKEAPVIKKEFPSIYESSEFKAMIEVLDINEDEAKVFMAFMLTLQTDTQLKSVEQAMIDVPTVVGKHVSRQAALTKMRDDFYKTNPELVEFKIAVEQIANSVSASNPDWDMPKVLTATATKTYEILNIKKGLIKAGEKAEKRKPAFAKGSKGGRKKPLKKSTLQNDMDAMINLD